MNNGLVQCVIDVLAEHGPQTQAEIRRELGQTKQRVAAALARLIRANTKDPKRAYILRWVRQDDVARRYLRPVYDLGDRPDAPRPPPEDKRAIKKRWRDGKAKVPNSVFQLGMTREQRSQERKRILSIHSQGD